MTTRTTLTAVCASAALLLGGCVVPATPSTPNGPAAPAAPAANDTLPGETTSQSNARRSAQNYLQVAGFSRSGLITQLEYEGFSTADANYAVDALDVDWNQQAARSAANYLDTAPFSRSGLIEQLEYEGFTRAQAEYGVSTTGL